ncbi:MAG: CusA/CzcA family heavy metal efflux RND transporter [Prolixibacteraceae bacterium]|jgi:cobalt-zinc-cadmium resistance protein CzcA|nr:CusA/CzcA family heavy metal efflux RND transporter [Prolixibacteraceae bacterium]
MLNRIIQFSINNKLIAFLLTLTIAAFGIFALSEIPLGAVPDITNNQVQVITTSKNLSTQDVEQFITYPVELEMSNLPGVKEIRSISKFGLSVVTIVFEDNMGTYLPRQLIAEKIKSASENIPQGFGTPEMGPISTGLGEIYQYVLDTKPGYKDQYTTMELRTLQDWVVKRQLSGIPGIVEINTWGGFLKQYEVAVDPEKLKGFDITLIDVYDALSKNNSVAGGAYIEKQNETYFIRGDGLVNKLDDIKSIVIKNENGVPLLVNDVANVQFGSANRFGAITANGEGEKVMGQIMMLKDANSNEVINAVKQRVDEIQKNLPEGVYINPIVERSELISRTSFTVFENLLIGFIIIFLVVLLILGNFRSALVISSIIPLSMLFTISLMYLFGIDANLMSLGALDFGIIIDGAVIIVEFIAVNLTLRNAEIDKHTGTGKQKIMDKITFSGASKMMNSAIFGQLIILIVFIPILSLGDVEGKMFRPMALSFSFALLGAMFFGLTWLPAISSLVLKPVPEEKTFKITRWMMKWIYRSFDPVIRWSYRYKKWVLTMGVASLVLTGVVFSRMGGEFVPTLDEGDFVIQPILKTGTSLSKTIELTTQMEQILIEKFPEVEKIVSRIGAAEVPTDPMSMEEIDMIIKLNPNKDEWTTTSSKEDLATHFKEALSVIPNVEYEFTQPIEMRFNELITGVRSDLAIKIFGEDLDVLNQKAIEAKSLIENVPGAADVVMEKTAGLPQMSVKYNRSKIAYYGLNIEELNNYVSMAFGGKVAGSVFEGERRFDMVARLQPSFRDDIEHIRNLYVALPDGNQIPLSELAEINYTTGPAMISRDNTSRRIVVSVNVRNSDLQTVVDKIRPILDKNLNLPSGYYVEYGGQFENLDNATQRLKLAVPVALLLIFIFLHFAFNSFREAALVFTAVPLSIVGGVMLLWIRGMPFSISAGVGFIALFGIAVLNGIVLIEHLKELKKEGVTDMRERVIRGTKERLRPVLLTASSTMMGFLPMAISTSAGAEVQRPLATVVIGGLITSTMLTMIALPLLYSIFDNKSGRDILKMFLPAKKSIPVILLAFMLIPAFSAKAQTHEISFNKAVTIAMHNNTGLKSVEHYYKQQRALVPSAFDIEKTQIYYEYDENNIAANGYPLGIVGVEQSFKFPTVYLAQRKAAGFNVKVAEKEYERAKLNLQKNVALAFYKIRHLQQKQKNLQVIDSVYTNYTAAAEKQFQSGEISKLDFLNAKSQHNRLKIQVKQIKSDINIAHEEFNTLLQSDTSYTATYQPLKRIDINLPQVENTPGYQALEKNIQQNNAVIKTEKNKLLPDITLGYFNGTNTYDNADNYYGVHVGLAIPLFFGNQKAQIDAAKQEHLSAVFKQHDYKMRYNLKLKSLQKELEKYYETLQYYEDTGLSLSEQITETARKSYDAGEIDFFRFVHSLENAINIKIEYINSLQKYNNTVLEINFLTLN